MSDKQPAANQQTATELEAEQDALTAEYLRLKPEAEKTPQSKRDLQKLVGKLDSFYWKKVLLLIADRLAEGGDTLDFSDQDRLLLDVGLLDPELVDNGDDSLSEQLLDELATPGPVNHYYLSEWLEDRLRRYLVSRDMEKAAAEKQSQASGEMERLRQAREKIFARLKPLLSGLPGVNDRMAELIATGKLDDHLQLMSMQLMDGGSRQDFLRRSSLRGMRLSVLSKLRARLSSENDFKLLDLLDTIYQKMWEERLRGGSSSGAEASEAEAEGEKELSPLEFLESELRFAKSLLPLGALAAGLARPCAVLLENRARVTKAVTRAELARIRDCDRGFTADPVVVIAPYQGRGFFEWDRDSLFVPLAPSASPRDAIAHAAANLRMLMDSLQQECALKKEYEGSFAGVNFQQNFQKDYRDWILSCGSGRIGEMEAAHENFFRTRIGPDCDGVLAPANLRNLSAAARGNLKQLLERQLGGEGGDPNLRYRLGVLCWQDGEIEKAFDNMAKVAVKDQGNGAALFSLGLLFLRKESPAMAKQSFNTCVLRAPESIWASYARMMLSEVKG